MRASLVVLSLSITAAAIACGDSATEEPGPAGVPVDDATVPDAPLPPDARVPADATTQPDAEAPSEDAQLDAAEPDADAIEPGCGNGILEGIEACDVGGDAGSEAEQACVECRLQPGWVCPPGEACRSTRCGDGVIEGTEQCEDGNARSGDGCSPSCGFEPSCDQAGCTARCGDGIVDDGEACDDGNSLSNDGCSPACAIEAGWQCTEPTSPAAAWHLPILYRDFRGHDLGAVGPLPAGHVDFENKNGVEHGIVAPSLGADGLPIYAKTGLSSTTTSGKATFDQWYRETPDVNVAVPGELILQRQPNGQFLVNHPTFFPLDAAGFRATTQEPLRPDLAGTLRNFSFTSELHTWFRYDGTGTLTIVGDDDIWVFVNRRLAADLGGVHGAMSASVDLRARAQALTLEPGTLYEIAIFQAERHTRGSSYRLELVAPPQPSACVPAVL